MGKKKREECSKEIAEPIIESKRPRKGATKVEKEKPKKMNIDSEKNRRVNSREKSEITKKSIGNSDSRRNTKSRSAYVESSSSSDTESEKTFNKNDKKAGTDSNSESDSDSSDSGESSPVSREEPATKKASGKVDLVNVVTSKNSITNVMPIKSYVSEEKSSSSDSYHSDTEEEDKKRRKKQKKLLQMRLNKKVKKSNFVKAADIKEEVLSDADEEAADNVSSNYDEVPDWPESDYAELIRRMEAQIPQKDNQKFHSRAAKLDWTKIAFGDYRPEECLEVWLAISKRIRGYRLLSEILQDAKEWITKPWTNFYRGHKKNRHPDMPARPLSTYMIYYLEHKDRVAQDNPGLEMTQVSKIISEMYKNLSSEERDRYAEMAAQQRQKFDVKLSEFYKEHPEIAQQQQLRKIQAKEVGMKGPRKASNPFKLFFQEQLKKHGGDAAVDRKAIEEEAKEKWKNLSDKKKLVWIDWALADHKRFEDEMKVYKLEHPDYVPPNTAKSVLNKDERNIKERLAGKPIKPPNSAYSLFSRVMLQSDPDVKSIPPKQRMAEISRKWKEISNAQKAHYEEKVRTMQDAYKLNFASYLEGLSPEEREEELRKTQPKRKPTKAEEKAKKKAMKNKTASKSSGGKNKAHSSLKLFKGEPAPPPVRVFDVYLQSFPSGHKSESERLKEALKSWNRLSESKKDFFRKKHEELKQKYIEDFESFLKGLSPTELKEFSVMKELAKRNKESKEQKEVINGDGGDSIDESDEDSSSDSDSEESDSGKSSKSSSSSEESDC